MIYPLEIDSVERKTLKYKFKCFALVKLEKRNCLRSGNQKAEGTQA